MARYKAATSAKRLDAGSYEYRGYLIEDHGEGRSVHAASMRHSGRWLSRPMIDSYYKRGPTGLPYIGSRWDTLAEAKRAIDYRLRAHAEVIATEAA